MIITQTFYYIKYIVILEFILVIAFILFSYGAKGYFFVKQRYRKRKYVATENLFLKLANDEDASTQNLNKLVKFDPMLLQIIPNFDLLPNLPHWPAVRNQIIQQVLIPAARRLAIHKKWIQRYHASACFYFGFSADDEVILKKLVEDTTMAVSINAAQVVVKKPTPLLINAIIDRFEVDRQLLQTVFVNILTDQTSLSNDAIITPVIMKRLTQKGSDYVKILCYQFLTNIAPQKENNPNTLLDLESENIDLKIAVLHYLSNCLDSKSRKILRSYIKYKNWEVRAAVSKLLGKLQDKISIPLLNDRLKDTSWWVRVNAAEALTKFGKEGFAILKKQDPHFDPYAYAAAQHVLLTIKNEEKNADG